MDMEEKIVKILSEICERELNVEEVSSLILQANCSVYPYVSGSSTICRIMSHTHSVPS